MTSPNEHRIRSFLRTLPGRMIASLLVLTLILGTLLIWSILFFSIRAQRAYFLDNARQQTRALAEVVGDNPQSLPIRSLLANAAQSHEVVYLEFDGTSGPPEVAKGRNLRFVPDHRFGEHGDHVCFLSAPVLDHHGARIGVLKAGFDEQPLDNQERHIVTRSVVFSLVYMWALMLITASLAMRLTNPIKRLQAACRAIASGEIDNKLTVTTDVPEIRGLVADLEHMRRELVARNKQIAAILDNAAEGIFTFDRHGIIQSFNRSAEELFGYTAKEIVGRDISLLIAPPDSFDGHTDYLEHFMRAEVPGLIGHEDEVLGAHKDGTRFHMALKLSAAAHDDQEIYTALAADISERKAMMQHLKSVAEHDGLTGLYNRSYFLEQLEHLVALTKRSGQCSALFYIDLDHFKYVNDTLGHSAGDRLLIEISGILIKRARNEDLIARLGGDEFTVLLQNICADQVYSIAESFRTALADYPFRQGGEQVNIGCSIGVAMIGEEARSAGDVLSRADISCHLAKHRGRNRVHIFNSADEADVTDLATDMGWSRRIKEAVESGYLVLARQPIVSTLSGEVESFEVLIRMRDGRNGFIMPDSFLPSADRFGLAKEVDKWVIVKAIESLAVQRTRLPELRYSLNLSGQTLCDPEMCVFIQQALQYRNLDPASLTFEVAETVAISDMAVAETFLSRLREIGCKTSLDDFGSGMSSFGYLRDLPVDYVKIDERYIRKMATSPVDEAIVKAMNEIAHALGKQTIAEAVEDEATMKLVRAHGIDYAQGYHLGRPTVIKPCEAILDQAGAQ